MFRSLWFRLTGTVVFVVVVTMVVVMVASLIIMQREFVGFVNSAVDAFEQQRIEITESETGRTTIEIPEIPVRPTPFAFEDILDGRFRDLIEQQTAPSISVTVPQAVQQDAVQFLQTMRDTTLISVGISGGLAILASTWLFWQITRPLSKLRQATEAVADGDLSARAPVKRKDEVGLVADAFNTMADELERQEGLRKQMVADVAHELRTPLSVMLGNLEAMIDELIPASEEELEAVHKEVLRLGRLVEDLRILSLADAGELQLSQESIDVAELVETAVRRMTPTAQSKGVSLVGDIGQNPGHVEGDEGKLQQVLANLIGNAIRYAPAGTEVILQAGSSREEVNLVISDQGPGIDPDELPNFFERFWKGDRSRARVREDYHDGSGSGLGLSIVRQLVELHNGRVEASLPDGGGLRVTVTLPVASDRGKDKISTQ
jgi:signal transduction histidine kinase